MGNFCLPRICRTPNRARRGLLKFMLVVASILAYASFAVAQSFTLQMQGFSPGSVLPNGTASSNLVLTPLNGFNETVSFTCAITPAPPGNQGCLVSPATVTPPTGAAVTITTDNSAGSWTAGSYTVTITATPSSGTGTQMASQLLTVLSVTPTFTITLQQPITPTSVPAGSAGKGTINVNPVNGYTGNVTLSCSSVNPVVVSPPVCAFNPAIVNVPATTSSTLLINTIGPLTPITQTNGARGYYAFLLPLPMLALLGAGARRTKLRLWGFLLLLLASAMILLMPACGTTTTPTPITNTSLITPNGTYTFTVTGVDANGISASNTTSTVTLSVTTATTD